MFGRWLQDGTPRSYDGKEGTKGSLALYVVIFPHPWEVWIFSDPPFITASITGVPPPQIDEGLEDQLIQMFKMIQAPFQKNKPSSRKNFLSYSYVLQKLFELMGRDEFLPYLQLLKSQEKLRQCDNIWKLMCRDLNWEFIPTL